MAKKKKDKPSWRDILRPLFQTTFRPPLQLPQTINESRRALALLRSLPKETQLKVKKTSELPTYRPQDIRGVSSYSAATNRSIGAGVTPPTAGRKLPTSGIIFSGPNGYGDAPFPGGASNAKHQGFLWQLGDVIESLPAGGVSGHGIDDKRRKVYQRYGIGPEGQAFKRSDGRLQPRDQKGKLGKATDTAGRLKGGLTRMAAGNVVRQLAPKFVQQINHPYAQAYLNVDDLIRQITGEGITERTVGGTRDQLQRTLEKDQTINFGPLLPF
jgi:hypothetical protein